MVLDYKGLAYEAIDGLKPEARDDLLRVNPRVEVPVLVNDGLTIVNSSDIVAYLNERYPSPSVYPGGLGGRIEARKWERLSDTALDSIIHDVSIWMWAYPAAEGEPPPGLREAAANDLQSIYAELDRVLAGGPFICGEISVADFALFPHLSGVRALGMPFSPEQHPHLFGWYQRMRTHPVGRADIERTKSFLSSASTGGGLVQRIFWRGDRIEWLLAHGFH